LQKQLSPAVAWYSLLLCVFGFCALRAQKPNTKEEKVPLRKPHPEHRVTCITESNEGAVHT
jgi:hypothetical protein